MAATPKRTDRDRSTEFRGFLKGLKDWDSVPKERTNTSKTPAQEGKKDFLQNTGKVIEGKAPPPKTTEEEVIGKPNYGIFSKVQNRYKYNNFRYVDATSDDEERPPDAVSEKELGNDYFKQKKFQESIDCYSRSIAFTPTSVAFANRAMAYLKVGRYEDAEKDCTEALELDDRYVKAYSRRATARKELGKLKESMEDCEFAISLDPNSPDLRKQYSDTKAIYDKKMQGAQRKSVKDTRDSSEMGEKNTLLGFGTDSNSNQVIVMPSHSVDMKPDIKQDSAKQMWGSSVDIANRAATRAAATASKNLTSPRNAYEFEVSWRSLSDDQGLQAQLLKMIPPGEFPQIFKNALSASIVVDIVRCTALFFREETGLAVSIMENLTRVPRFDLVIMCLSVVDRLELGRIWDQVFSSKGISTEHLEAVSRLRLRYLSTEMLA